MKTGVIAIIVLVLSLGMARAQGDREGQERNPERMRDLAKRREMMERRGVQDKEAGERMMAERMDEASILERVLQNPRVAQELGLTEDQLNQIRNAMQDLQAEHTRLREQMEKAAIEQAQIMTAANLDEDKLMAAVEKTGAARTEIAKLRIKQLILVKKTLTPEQLEKARQLRQRFMDHWRERGAGQGEGNGARKEGKEWKEGRGGEAPGALLKERLKKRREEMRGTVTREATGDEADPQDPNH